MKAENTTKIQFDSLSINEAYARSVVAAFLARYDPTVPQLADLKTAVSEAVTNCIVHAYAKKNGGEENAEDKILIECAIECKEGEDGGVLHIDITDYGCGIGNVEQAMQPFFTTLSDDERSGMGFTIMQTFMTEFSVTSEEGKGTKVRMSKKIGAKDAADA